MKNTILSTITLMIMSINTYAGGKITPLAVPKTAQASQGVLNTVDGYIRLGYQKDDTHHQDLALGGKLHMESHAWKGLLVGASFYTSNSIKKHDGAGVAFFDANNDSYSILGEAYIQGQWGNTVIKVGRQEIDTPFADTDDVGMIPNTFEALVLTNKDISNTTFFLAQLQRWSGVDSDAPQHFNTLNGNDGVQVLGITYEGITNTTLSGWYYHIQNSVKVGYLDIYYAGESKRFSYTLDAQYTVQDYDDNSKSTVYGLNASFGHKHSRITASIAYNKVVGRAAENYFGGGPYFSNAEHHTLSEAGTEGESTLYRLEWDASSIGVEGLMLSATFDRHSNGIHRDTHEYDTVLSYDYSDTMNVTAIYSHIDDEINAFTNLRVFANYSF